MMQPARPDSVGPFLVLPDLLKGNPQGIGQLRLTHRQHRPPHADSAADMLVDGVRGFGSGHGTPRASYNITAQADRTRKRRISAQGLRGQFTATLLASVGRGMIPAMGQDRKQATPDLFSTAPFGETSPSATKPASSTAPERRHVLPKDLPNAVKHLTDQELDSLIAASLEEAKRRGRAPAGFQTDEPATERSPRTDDRRQGEVAVSLTRGQINAVRAAFKAGIKPSLISRQFGISQADVRKVLASDKTTRG
jgi:hypothetical protein